MSSLKIIVLACASLSMSVGFIANANAKEGSSNHFARNDPPPKWATSLPFKTLTCRETHSSGVEAKNAGYQRARYPLKSYTISKLTPDQMKEDQSFCHIDDRQGAWLDKESGIYSYEACYRFTGALNALKSTQGWCTEMYRKGRPTNVTCDFNQPILSFDPGGEFMAYGRRLNFFNPEEPRIPAAFTSHGTCSRWTNQLPKPLVNFK